MATTTRQAVMQLLDELAKHASPNDARLYKQSKVIHGLVPKIAVLPDEANSNPNERRFKPAGFKRGKDRDLWLAQRQAAA